MTVPSDVLHELVEQLAAEVEARVLAHLEERERERDERDGAVANWCLVDATELARRLGRSRRWVDDAVAKRGLPYVRLDGRGGRAFDLEMVRDWARARSVPLQAASSVDGSGERDGR